MKRTVVGILAIAALAQGAALKTVCSSGCDYTTPQAAINAAEFGGIIELKAGETFSGEMQLKKKTGTPAYITIRSSRSGELPGGVRVTPADTAKMAKVQNNANVITVEAGASYYRLEGLEVAPTSGSFVYFLLALWPQSPSGGIGIHDPSDRAHHLIIDRCYLHGLPAEDGPQIGVYLETGYTEIINSWVGEIKSTGNAVGFESKAVLNVGGTGPFVFRNNHLEATSITTLMGGADPEIRGQRATDVQFLGNHYYRPWKWRTLDVTSDPTGSCKWDSNGGEFAHNTANGTYWQCQSGTWTSILVGAYPTLIYFQKNHYELKNASRVLFDGNLIENAWLPAAQSQRGAAILYNQVDYDPGSGVYERAATVEWAVAQNNRIKNTTFGVSMGQVGGPYTSKLHDLRFENNLWEGLAWTTTGNGSNALIQTGSNNERTYFVHNTFLDSASASGNIAVMDCSGTDLTYEMGWIGNISGFLDSGFVDFEKARGGLNNALDVQWDQPSRLLSKSVVVDVQNRRPWPDYPKKNLLTASEPPQSGTIPCPSCAVGDGDGGPWYWENGGNHDVGFVDYAGGNFRLGSSSPYKGWAHEGTDPGADIDTVEWSTAHAADGANNPYLDFRVRAVTPGRTSAGLRFTAYDLNSCRVMVSDRPDFATTVFDHTDEGGNRDRASEVGGLSANTRYFYRVLCSGSRRRDGMFLTAP